MKDVYWLPVAWQLEVRDAVMAFKCLHRLAPAYLQSKFIVRANVHSLNTRHRNKLDVPLFKTATGQQPFVFRATRLWNELTWTLTDVNSFSNFN